MKNTIPYALSLLALGGVVPCLAAEAPAAAATSELPAPVVKVPQYYYAMSEHFEMTVDFPVPMVPESAVGKPAEPGVVKVSHADAISMVWLSQSRLLLKPTWQIYKKIYLWQNFWASFVHFHKIYYLYNA